MRACSIMCWKLTFETYWRITVCIRLYQYGMGLNTMFWCCCYISEFSAQINSIQFWVSGTSFWHFSNFSLLTCQILFLMRAFFFFSSSADMDFSHIYESYLMLLTLWWVIFAPSTVFMMSLWEQRRPETWLKGWDVLNSTNTLVV